MRHRRGDEHRARAGSPSRAGARGPRRAACAPRPGRRRKLAARARPRRLRAPAAVDHRPRARRPADARRRTATGSPTTARSTTTSSCAKELGEASFATDSDTEVILRAYAPVGPDCLDRLRGMFAFALWDEREQTLFVARDRFGIKPLYYAVVDGIFYCASEAKALLPFLPGDRDRSGRAQGLPRLPVHARRQDDVPRRARAPAGAHADDPERLDLGPPLLGGALRARPRSHGALPRRAAPRDPRRSRSASTFAPTSPSARTSAAASIRASSRALAARQGSARLPRVHRPVRRRRGLRRVAATRARSPSRGDRPARGRRSRRTTSSRTSATSSTTSTTRSPVLGRFRSTSSRELAAKHVKVVLGGQGGDEVFGGYARYLLAYFEQCIKAAIEGTMHRAEFVVTYESIIPNLEHASGVQAADAGVLAGGALRRPRRALLPPDQPRSRARGRRSTGRRSATTRRSTRSSRSSALRTSAASSYFDRMTHFDFKTLLPALLQVEDRVSMAHGLESRTPFVDHRWSSSRRRCRRSSSSGAAS